jgi:MOSC domain-containing protein YiiM
VNEDPAPDRGTVLAVCLGGGGIPKRAVDAARVGPLGLDGDRHRHPLHGGERRAVCLLSIEEVRALRADGVEDSGPGSYGENLLTEGLDFATLAPGDRLHVGNEVVLEVDDVREPCGVLKALDARFPDLMIGRSGLLCRVVHEGEVRPGDRVRSAAPAAGAAGAAGADGADGADGA